MSRATKKAHRVEEAVVPVEGDGTGHAEECGCGEVVARDGEAVLTTGELGSTGVEVGCLGLLPADHDDHGQGGDDEDREDRDVDPTPRR